LISGENQILQSSGMLACVQVSLGWKRDYMGILCYG